VPSSLCDGSISKIFQPQTIFVEEVKGIFDEIYHIPIAAWCVKALQETL
jgi:hypothetical protein